MTPRCVQPQVGSGGSVAAALALLMLVGCAPPAARDLTAWLADDCVEIGPASLPVLESGVYSATKAAARFNAAQNETIGFQLALRGAGTYRVRISDLRGAAGTISAAGNVALFRAEPVTIGHFAAWYPEHAQRPCEPTSFFDVLVPWEAPRVGGAVRLDRVRTALVWVDLRVPAGTAAGEYTGRLEVTDSSGRSVAFGTALTVRVVPAALPGPRSRPVICRVDPTTLLVSQLGWPRDAPEQYRLIPDSPTQLAAVKLVNATMELLHSHRATPVCWSAFPKYRLIGERAVEIDWDSYDQLVTGWLDGAAFADRVPLDAWALPVSLDYPSAARNGGVGSPRYARLLDAYLRACRQHFAERGWLDRAFVRLDEPAPLTGETVQRLAQLAGILGQRTAGLPLVVHLPARSLRGLGWHDAPASELREAEILAAPGMWYEPAEMERARALGRKTWLLPDQPPYTPSLAVEAPAADARALPWLAYRLDAGALWIERALGGGGEPGAGAPGPLAYPGGPYGLTEETVPSIRLKRLRRGIQDTELLHLLESGGKSLLARTIAARLVGWGGTDAAVENLLSTRPAGWPRDPAAYALARTLLLQELTSALSDADAADAARLANLADWSLVLNNANRVRARCVGVRLRTVREQLQADALVEALNASGSTLAGHWTLPSPPAGWNLSGGGPTVSAAPGARHAGTLTLALAGLSFNPDGVYPFDLQFDCDTAGALVVPARLAVAAAPYVKAGPRVDGDLSDWPVAPSNSAGDFRLVRGGAAGSGEPARPRGATSANFCLDAERLFIGIRCELSDGQPPQWRADNVVTLDGNVPWGQDLVEILLDPRDVTGGGPGDLRVLQIKPSGVVVASLGCRTDPPMGPSQPWQCNAQVAVKFDSRAWVVEAAVPLAALGPQALQHRIWGANIARLDSRNGEYSSWSGARGHCYAPQRLGNLLILRP